MNEIRKSINAVLYERISSPLYGTFVISWLVWNWKIIYVSIFVSESKIDSNRIEYIIANSDKYSLVWYPLFSTIILLTLIPFLSQGAYWLKLKFEQWRKKVKVKIEKESVVTYNQYSNIINEIENYKIKVNQSILSKDSKIKELEDKLDIFEKSATQESISAYMDETLIRDKATKILINKNLLHARSIINKHIQSGYIGLSEKVDSEYLSFFESNDLIENIGNGKFKITKLGQKVNKYITEKSLTN